MKQRAYIAIDLKSFYASVAFGRWIDATEIGMAKPSPSTVADAV